MSPNIQKELKEIRKEAERQGWRVFRDSKYWKMYCPCPRKCKKTMKLSPSDANYIKNLRGQLGRKTCWRDGEEK